MKCYQPADNTDTSKNAEGNPVTDQANKDLTKDGTKKDKTGGA